VATRLGIPVSELEQRMDYAELLEWGCYFDIEIKQHSKQDYYLAQIAGIMSGGKSKKIADFLIKFGKEKKKPIKLSSGEQISIFKNLFGIKK